jgi:hypothetical protein
MLFLFSREKPQEDAQLSKPWQGGKFCDSKNKRL